MTAPSEPARGSAVRGGIVMLVLSLALFWVPVIGPLAAGLVGGRMTGSVAKAVVVALLPAILLGVLVGVVLANFDLPLLGTLAGLGWASSC